MLSSKLTWSCLEYVVVGKDENRQKSFYLFFFFLSNLSLNTSCNFLFGGLGIFVVGPVSHSKSLFTMRK